MLKKFLVILMLAALLVGCSAPAGQSQQQADQPPVVITTPNPNLMFPTVQRSSHPSPHPRDTRPNGQISGQGDKDPSQDPANSGNAPTGASQNDNDPVIQGSIPVPGIWNEIDDPSLGVFEPTEVTPTTTRSDPAGQLIFLEDYLHCLGGTDFVDNGEYGTWVDDNGITNMVLMDGCCFFRLGGYSFTCDLEPCGGEFLIVLHHTRPAEGEKCCIYRISADTDLASVLQTASGNYHVPTEFIAALETALYYAAGNPDLSTGQPRSDCLLGALCDVHTRSAGSNADTESV